MAKIPFDIKYRPQIESGEYRVETRNGLPVRIICWDRKHGYPIVGLVYDKTTRCESYVSAYADGTTSINGKMELSDDLFLITPDPEVDLEKELEKELDNFGEAYATLVDRDNNPNQGIRVNAYHELVQEEVNKILFLVKEYVKREDEK